MALIWAGDYGKYSISAQRHIDHVLPHVSGRTVAIQAGGHAGQFPVYLAQHFGSVHTFEPRWEDFRDLVLNLSASGVTNVYPCRGMLGSECGTGTVEGPSGSAHRKRGAPGACPIHTLDCFGFQQCDLLYLDVEGDELPILQGAHCLIRRCRPVVVVEDRGKGEPCADYLASLGYEHVDRYMADAIWRMRCA